MKTFKEKNLYLIEVLDNNSKEKWYSFGKNMEIIPGTSLLKVKSPFKQGYKWRWPSDDDYYLSLIEPYKSCKRSYVDDGYVDMIFSNFSISNLHTPEDDWIERTRQDIEKLKEQSLENYNKLSRWEKFKISLPWIFFR